MCSTHIAYYYNGDDDDDGDDDDGKESVSLFSDFVKSATAWITLGLAGFHTYSRSKYKTRREIETDSKRYTCCSVYA